MNIDVAKNMIKEAGDCLEEAERAYSKLSYNLSVRRAQETVELSMKGILRLIGIEYPKKHDVGDVFIEQMMKYSQDIDVLEKISEISLRLTKEREASFYMERLYSEATAREAVDGALFVYEYAKKLLRNTDEMRGNKL